MNKDKVYWCLREGDFRPERLEDLAMNSNSKGGYWTYPNKRVALEQLTQSGNLFAEYETALRASKEVRALLRELRIRLEENQEYNQCIEKYFQNNRFRPAKVAEEIYQKENQVLHVELQQPISQNASRREGDDSQANDREIHLIIHLKS